MLVARRGGDVVMSHLPSKNQHIFHSLHAQKTFSLEDVGQCLDLDHFKALNDGYGHTAGDAVLCEFASLIRAQLPRIDTVGRWGGEEFVAILPELQADEALALAEEVRAAVAAHTFNVGGGLHLTCSAGIASYPVDAQEREGLLSAADHAMYGAKRFGRNQMRAANDPAVLALFSENYSEE